MRCSYSINNDDETFQTVDKVKEYLEARYITRPKAIWSTLEYKMQEQHPSVIQLSCHLPEQQRCTWTEQTHLEDTVEKNIKTTLTEYFVNNKKELRNGNRLVKKILYQDYPKHFWWNASTKVWTKRAKQVDVVGRIDYCHKSEEERYFLRILLNHHKGSTSYTSLKRGKKHLTFRQAW